MPAAAPKIFKRVVCDVGSLKRNVLCSFGNFHHLALFCPVKHGKMHFLRDSKVGLKEEEHHMRDDDSLGWKTRTFVVLNMKSTRIHFWIHSKKISKKYFGLFIF